MKITKIIGENWVEFWGLWDSGDVPEEFWGDVEHLELGYLQLENKNLKTKRTWISSMPKSVFV